MSALSPDGDRSQNRRRRRYVRRSDAALLGARWASAPNARCASTGPVSSVIPRLRLVYESRAKLRRTERRPQERTFHL